MKILHSKAVAEPIVLISACHNMNLFAVVTRTTVSIYRSTTLTVVATLSLRTGHVAPLMQSAARVKAETNDVHVDEKGLTSPRGVHAVWSPTGRLFALSLPNGCVLLLDVEDGDLVRRFVPAGILSEVRQLASTQEEDPHPSSRASSMSSPLGWTSTAEGTATPHANASQQARAAPQSISDAVNGEEAEEEEDVERALSALALRIPSLSPLSTAACPVAAMTWTTLRTTSTSPAPTAQCLPLRPSLSTPLIAEAHQSCQSVVARGTATADAVTILLVMDVTGGLSYLVGGLQEAAFHRVQMPAPIDLCSTGSWRVKHFIVAPSRGMKKPGAANHRLRTIDDVASLADLPASILSFGTTRRSLSFSARDPGKPSLVPTDEDCGYMVITQHPDETTNGGPVSSDQLIVVPLGDRLRLLGNPRIAMLCCVAEYCRTAATCQRAVSQWWDQVLRQRVRGDLQLPQHARLLRDAVVEHAARPDPEALYRYYAGLDRATLQVDVAKITASLFAVAKDVSSVCYRSYDHALSLIGTLQRHHGRSAASDSVVCGKLWSAVGSLRRQSEEFLRRAQLEGDHERELVHYVLQRAALVVDDLKDDFTFNKAADDDTVHPSPLLDVREPLRVVRQPTLLRSLERISQGQSTVLPTPPSANALPSTDCGSPALVQALVQRGIRYEVGSEEGDRTATVFAYLLASASDEQGVRIDLVPAAATGSSAANEEENKATEAGDEEAPSAPHFAFAMVSRKFSDEEHVLQCASLRVLPHWTDHLMLDGLAADGFHRIQWEPAADALPQEPTLWWHAHLREDRHLCLFTGNGGGDAFGLAMIDEKGRLVPRGSGDEDEDEDEEGLAERNQTDESDTTRERGEAGRQSEFMVAKINGMPLCKAPLLVTVSRLRELCVIAAHNRMIVIDLFDD